MEEHPALPQVQGFQFAGIHCGIKDLSKKPDLALIYSATPCSVAATFTTSAVKAPPVLLSIQKMKQKVAQAILINSGNANACTGKQGLKDAEAMANSVAKTLKISPESVHVASTGKIGIPMPMDKIKSGIVAAAGVLDAESLPLAAKAIMTTDQFPKIAAAEGKIKSKPFKIVGFAKGAGMIEPSMKPAGLKSGKPASGGLHATMLAYFMTDLKISSSLLQAIFTRVVERTFNSITVDGDMSTNDTAMILANGLAENNAIQAGSSEAKIVEAKLEEVARSLALKMVEDGEGATKVVELKIKGAASDAEAKTIAYRVGRSQLVKCAFFGEDPNWGRLLAAVGYSGAKVNPDKVDIFYDKVKVVSGGVSTGKELELQAHAVMKNQYFSITIDLKLAKGAFKLWTSDLTVAYVKLNAEYRT